MKEYTVIKRVEYYYTIEADNADEAEYKALQAPDSEAFQVTIGDVFAESNEDYEASIEE